MKQAGETGVKQAGETGVKQVGETGLKQAGETGVKQAGYGVKQAGRTGIKQSKGKGMFLYSAVSSLLDRSKRFTLFAPPGRPVHSDTNSASQGSILVMQQLRAKTKSLTSPPLSIARYSFIQLSRLRRHEEKENAQTSKR